MSQIVPFDDAPLLGELRALIESARSRAAVAVNRELVLLYFDLGQRVRVEILGEARAEYGAQILPTLSAKLKTEFGDGFSERNLARMIKFAETFPERGTVERLSETLSWSHLVEILALRDPLEREFYATMSHASRWSVRALRREIADALWTRTALSRNSEELMRQELAALRDEDKWTPELVFRSPYLLSFLDLADTYSERDLELALVREIERFLLELGEGFAFVARQKRMVIDGRDFSLDLLFYHRGLRRLVALDLKIGPFEPAFKGQMELYLRWLDKHERAPSEEAPVGLILCAEAGSEQLELLQIGQADIHVAEYITRQLPPALLQQKLRQAQRQGLVQIAPHDSEASKNAN